MGSIKFIVCLNKRGVRKYFKYMNVNASRNNHRYFQILYIIFNIFQLMNENHLTLLVIYSINSGITFNLVPTNM